MIIPRFDASFRQLSLEVPIVRKIDDKRELGSSIKSSRVEGRDLAGLSFKNSLALIAEGHPRPSPVRELGQ